MESKASPSTELLPEVFTSLQNAPIEVEGVETELNITLTSKIVAVALKTEDSTVTYHLHSSLLCRESERFLKDLTGLDGSHVEATQLKIDLVDECPPLFAHFTRYIYQPQWDFTVTSIPDILTLTKMYAMAERLMATKFQSKVEGIFNANYRRFQYENSDLCDLLGISCESITERKPEVPIRDTIFRLAASKLVTLQNFELFQDMLQIYPDLARCICLRAGNAPSSEVEEQGEDPWANSTPKGKKWRKPLGQRQSIWD